MKTRLEEALEKLESNADIFPSKYSKSLKGRSIDLLYEARMQNRRELSEQLWAFEIKRNRINKQYEKISLCLDVSTARNPIKIYLRMSQPYVESLDLQPGFTALEEIVKQVILCDWIYLSRERPKCFAGDYVYTVSETGMIDLIESKPDSSD